jgi:hypothetical protein
MGTKGKVTKMVKYCPIKMNGINKEVDLNLLSFDWYGYLIGMDKLEKHHVVLDCYNKTITCLDEEG